MMKKSYLGLYEPWNAAAAAMYADVCTISSISSSMLSGFTETLSATNAADSSGKREVRVAKKSLSSNLRLCASLGWSALPHPRQ